MALKTSQVGIDLIKSFEGCYLKAYRCPAGVWTIGWGTTEPVNGKKPYSGMVITQAQADQLLVNHLKAYEDAVKKLNVTFNQNQFDALVSFCYNLGTGIFKGNLLSAIKSGNEYEVADQLLMYNKARVNGVLTELNGLTRRRQAERDLYLKPIEVAEDKQLADAVSKIIRSGININFNSWKRIGLINLNNVPSLLTKLGGLDKLSFDKVISDKQLWLTKQYNANHVRSLLIKYASTI